jgi:uncharacterized protein (DUF2249 family)
MVISRTDRVSTVIAGDESLIDVFVSLSPAFERLRVRGMRRVMARLVTVEQAARMAGVDVDELVSRLNAHDAATPDAISRGKEGDGDDMLTADAGPRPQALAAIPDDRIVMLDVRDELRAGREPFSRIMAALRTVPPGGAFSVRAIFEPVPLYAVLKKQGFDHWTERLAEDDWLVWFYPSAAAYPGVAKAYAATAGMASDAARSAPLDPMPGAETPLAAEPAADESDVGAAGNPDDGVIILDVRGLEPPEPMVRTLAALERLPARATLVQINVRVPQFLLPMLEERGFTFHVREQEPDLVRVFIRRDNPPGE